MKKSKILLTVLLVGVATIVAIPFLKELWEERKQDNKQVKIEKQIDEVIKNDKEESNRVKKLLKKNKDVVGFMQGMTEAEIMRAKGYTEKDVLQSEVQKAYAEGIGNMGPAISGGGGSSIVGDMMGLGVGMAAASAIAPQIGGMMQGFNMNANQNNMNPNGNAQNNMEMGGMPQQNSDTWDCSCGNKGVVGNFCNMCGAKKPEPVASKWDCSCGNTGIVGNFCNICGKKRGE